MRGALASGGVRPSRCRETEALEFRRSFGFIMFVQSASEAANESAAGPQAVEKQPLASLAALPCPWKWQ